MIIYFSATGNSKYVADRISEKLQIKTESLTNLNSEVPLLVDDVFGFISPTYHWGLPSIVKEFLKAVSFQTKPKYSFFVATYGTTSGQTGQFVENYLSDKGIRLDSKFSIKMPDTWTPVFDLSNTKKVAKINENAEPQIDNVIRHIMDKAIGDYMKAKVPMFAVKMFNPTYEKERETRHLNLLDSCIGCGLCAKQCPIQAINMVGKKPVWVKDKCVMCLGCLHRCPKFSIQYGNKTINHGQYIHPHYLHIN